jgi:hypothetical protein
MDGRNLGSTKKEWNGVHSNFRENFKFYSNAIAKWRRLCMNTETALALLLKKEK